MAGTVRARVRGGHLEPVEPLELPEGKEVTLMILDVPSAADREAFLRAAGGWKETIDADALIRAIYADRLFSTRAEPSL